ncbi:MFS transporter [Amaricoccus solimangrovi]|uniref:MFS transporter n=1 Tax=Amaricoccus solimangrovi TaxID=2589815 RepID=A0A501WLV3_9RHOB|nr:MFS transporter [Amaricoccus solimangrovi]TPE49355.1 MFS transporter [Amaricoccus solimangrovi]
MASPLRSAAGRHTAAFYASFFMVSGVYMPFWPLWLAHWGLSPGEVGLFTSLGIGIRVVAGLIIPALADRLDARRHTIAVCCLFGAAILVCHLWIARVPVLLLGTLATGACLAAIGPIGEALGTAASRFHGFDYAPARGLGSIGFMFANLAVGALISALGVQVALWWMVVCFLLAALLVARHPGGRRVQGQIPPRIGEIRALVTNPVFCVFVAALSFTQASHAVFYAYGTIHWTDLGLSETRIGALWAAGVGAEIVFMITVGGAVAGRLGPVRALGLSGLAGILRWAAMMFDPTGWVLWPLMGLHALTFAAGHLGAMAFITRAIPARFGAAAQGAAAAMAAGLILSLATAGAAWAYPRLGGLSYGIGLGMSALGLGVCVLLGRVWRGQELAV